MNLAIFDIDGTLTATNQVDADCFVQAIADVFSVHIKNTDWNSYTTYSDSGITAQIFQEQFGRLPDASEWQKLIDHFVALLQKAYQDRPEQFSEIAGASEMFKKLITEPHWTLAIATGCWQASAKLKLNYADIDYAGMPLAHSDEIFTREAIIQHAIEKARIQHQNQPFDRIVYVGDGKWDVRATKILKLNFVGISNHINPELLLEEGAKVVLPDYRDYLKFMQALETATVPE